MKVIMRRYNYNLYYKWLRWRNGSSDAWLDRVVEYLCDGWFWLCQKFSRPRVWIKIEPQDIVNAHITIAYIVKDLLSYYLEHSVSYGIVDEQDKKPTETDQEAWERTIRQIIKAFELMIEDDPALSDPNDPKYHEFNQGLVLFSRYYYSLWD